MSIFFAHNNFLMGGAEVVEIRQEETWVRLPPIVIIFYEIVCGLFQSNHSKQNEHHFYL